MAAINNDWLDALNGEFKKDYYNKLYGFVQKEYNSKVIYPPADDIFDAFHFTPLKEVKVLLLTYFFILRVGACFYERYVFMEFLIFG